MLKCPPADVAVNKKLRAAVALHAKWNRLGQFFQSPPHIPVPASLEKANKELSLEQSIA